MTKVSITLGHFCQMSSAKSSITQGRNWCFTLNNFTTTDLKFTDKVAYAIWQHEVGESGTPHLQGYIEFTRSQQLTACKKLLPTAHWAMRKGSQAEARAYCMKKDSTYRAGPWEYGEFREHQQGHRTDIDEVVATLRDEGYLRAVVAHPGYALRYAHGMREIAAAHKALRPVAFEEVGPLRAWQQSIVDIVSAPANRRTIHWIRDSQGAVGKSYLVQYLRAKFNAVSLNGRYQDMAYIYDEQPVVCFDLERCTKKIVDVCRVAEALKNGCIISTKYIPVTKSFVPPHVFIFSNDLPPLGAWSEDRLNLIDLDPPELDFIETNGREKIISPAETHPETDGQSSSRDRCGSGPSGPSPSICCDSGSSCWGDGSCAIRERRDEESRAVCSTSEPVGSESFASTHTIGPKVELHEEGSSRRSRTFWRVEPACVSAASLSAGSRAVCRFSTGRFELQHDRASSECGVAC